MIAAGDNDHAASPLRMGQRRRHRDMAALLQVSARR